MQVSIVVPAYRAEQYVSRAVESALALSEVAEVIIVEDGSPDQTLDVCEQLCRKHEKVELLRHPDGLNHGAGASRNLGIQKARSEFLAFLDADDFYLPIRFAKDRRILESDPSIDGVYNALGFHYYSEQARERYEKKGFRGLTTLSVPVPPGELLMVLLGASQEAHGHFSLDTLTIRRDILGRTGLFDTELTLSQDTHFIMRLAAVTRLAAGELNRPVAMRGAHENNRVTDTERLHFFRAMLYEKLVAWGEANNMSSEALLLCKDKSLVWRRYHEGLFENLIFLARLPSKYPSIFHNKSLCDQAILGSLGHNVVAGLGIRIKDRLAKKLPSIT